jgi:transcriptional regulator with XRE-family HTH domain
MDQRQLGIRIRQRREALGMSQIELGKKVGVAAGTISRLESAKSGEPTYEVVRNLADALDTSTGWLIDGGSTDFRMAMARLEVDPVVKEALLRISAWFETATEHERETFRRNMETMGRMFERRDTTIRALSSEDVAERVSRISTA